MSARVATVLPLAALSSACVDYGLADPDELAVVPVRAEERFVQAPSPDVDVLFVVDGTGSMTKEQAALADRAAAFVSTLDGLGLAWQLGVTTSDPDDEGALIGRPWVLTPQTDDVATVFTDALLVGTERPPPSAGLDAAVLALEDPEGLNRGFRRADAALHVVFVSDGDDESGEVLGEDPVVAFVARLDAEAAESGRVVRASAVVGDVPGGCDGPTGSAQAGTRYAEVVEATGGVLASICDTDLAVVAAALGEVAVEWPTRFDLQAEPEAGSVVVEIDGERIVDGWSMDGATLVFAVAPDPGAEIVVSYTLADA
jgi:hypothetical protein